MQNCRDMGILFTWTISTLTGPLSSSNLLSEVFQEAELERTMNSSLDAQLLQMFKHVKDFSGLFETQTIQLENAVVQTLGSAI